MVIQKLKDGTLLVPVRIEGKGMIGDAVTEIPPNHKDYEKFYKAYLHDQEIVERVKKV